MDHSTPSPPKFKIINLKSLLDNIKKLATNTTSLEIFVWLVFLIVLGLFIISPLTESSLTHNFPSGYAAKDAYWHLAYEQRILRDGNYVVTPSDMANGVSGLLAIQPPWLYYTVASLASFLDIAVWDLNLWLLLMLMILSMILVYSLIRKISIYAALFSLPLMVLVFYFPFIAGLVWGQHLYIAGMFFLILSAALLLQLGSTSRKWLITLLLAVATSALNLAHPSEFGYLVLISLLIGCIWSINRRWRDIGWAALGTGLGLLISSAYLKIFINTWLEGGGDPIKLHHIIRPGNFGSASVYYTHFGWWWWLILAGAILSVIAILRRSDHSDTYAAFIGFFLVGFGTYLNQWRIYQFRFLWPIILAPFLGITLHHIFLLLFHKRSALFKWSLAASLFAALLFAVYYDASQGTLQTPRSLSRVSLYSNEEQKLVDFTQPKIVHGDEVLFYEPGTEGEKMYWMLQNARIYQIEPLQSLRMLQSGNTSSQMLTLPVCEGVSKRRDESGNYITDENAQQQCRGQVRSVCSFKHVVLFLRRMHPDIIPAISTIFSQEGLSIEYGQQGVVLLSNSNIREIC